MYVEWSPLQSRTSHPATTPTRSKSRSRALSRGAILWHHRPRPSTRTIAHQRTYNIHRACHCQLVMPTPRPDRPSPALRTRISSRSPRIASWMNRWTRVLRLQVIRPLKRRSCLMSSSHTPSVARARPSQSLSNGQRLLRRSMLLELLLTGRRSSACTEG